jgi:hypothetical protein
VPDQNTKNWRTIRGQRPLNESRIAAYTRLIQAEQRLAEMRRRRGVSQAVLADLLDACPDGQDDVYLATLARYVAALGGHLEVQAVFPEETVTLLREPAEGGAG